MDIADILNTSNILMRLSNHRINKFILFDCYTTKSSIVFKD